MKSVKFLLFAIVMIPLSMFSQKNLTNTYWLLTEVQEDNTIVFAKTTAQHKALISGAKLYFKSATEFMVSNSCMSVYGEFEMQENTISFSGMDAVKAADGRFCPDVYAPEGHYSYKVKGNKLILTPEKIFYDEASDEAEAVVDWAAPDSISQATDAAEITVDAAAAEVTVATAVEWLEHRQKFHDYFFKNITTSKETNPFAGTNWEVVSGETNGVMMLKKVDKIHPDSSKAYLKFGKNLDYNSGNNCTGESGKYVVNSAFSVFELNSDSTNVGYCPDLEFPNGIYSYELNGKTLEITSYHMMDITTVEN